MMRRNAQAVDAFDRPIRPADAGTQGLGLFEQQPGVPAWAQSWGSLTDDQRAAQRERWKELLRPVVLELVAKRGPEGIIAGDVIAEGIVRGLLWGERTFLQDHPRVYAWVGPWLASLAAQGTIAPLTVRLPNGSTLQVTRKSERSLSHGNPGGVFVALEYAA